MNTFDGPINVKGSISAEKINYPAKGIRDAAIDDTADIDAAKLQHQFQPGYAQESNTTAASESRVIFVVQGALAQALEFVAGSVVACLGDSTITVDCLKNGTTILSAPITLNSSNTARVAAEAAVVVDDAVEGDVFEISISVSAGTGTLGKGVFARLKLRQKAD